ncbi:MAG: hypothetical protein JWP47_1283 [Polaromonas sp.]|nr:hypothetical protein [Polaromonas sp.]
MLVVGALLVSGALVASAADSSGNTGSKKPGTKKSRTAETGEKPVTSKFLRGSEESAGERNARLKRECKGAVNAGVCAGYTR